jgi:hypothetical protein
MDLRITFDISDKLGTALCRLAAAIEAAGVCKALPVHSEAAECPSKSVETAPVAPIVSGQIITQPEPETVKTEPVLAQSEPAPEPAANDNAEESPKVEPEPVKKSAKKKAVKKAEIAPVAQVEPEQAITQPEPETVKTEPILTQSEPETVKAEEPAKATDDGMAGMNLMEAAKQLIEDIQDAGVEMADANARVRAKANELGLNFGSITCLIKAIGYIEAKKVAIGK